MREPLARHLVAMACNNAWANHRLLGACARLDDAAFAATRTSFFPSIRETANHLVTVDWMYVDALERAFDGRPPNPDPGAFYRPEQPFATCAPLAEAQRAVDRRLIAFCLARTDADLVRPVGIVRPNGVQRDEAGRMLAHLFQHQIHHRGQVHAMLAGTDVPPPQLDEFFLAGEAHLRAAELAELGVGEEEIWA